MSGDISEHSTLPVDDTNHSVKSADQKIESLQNPENLAVNVVTEVKSEITTTVKALQEKDNDIVKSEQVLCNDKEVFVDVIKNNASEGKAVVTNSLESLEEVGKETTNSFVEKGKETLQDSAATVHELSSSVVGIVQKNVEESKEKLSEIIDDAKKKEAAVVEEGKNTLNEAKEKFEESNQNIQNVANKSLDKTLEALENKKESVLTTVKHTGEAAQTSIDSCKSKVEVLRDDAAKKVTHATEEVTSKVEIGKQAFISGNSAGEISSKECVNKETSLFTTGMSKQKLNSSVITFIDDKSSALYAHNEIRKLHGVQLFKWDSTLADSAKRWAMELAESDLGLKHSCLHGYGENIYISKGTSKPVSTSQAVLQWYKTASQYRFHSPTFTLTTGTFTQLVWDESLNVGVGVAFHEEKKTTYIVAHYSPPGNPVDTRSYTKHVKFPKTGELPKAPKLEDLIPKDVSTRGEQQTKSKVTSLVEVLCRWCTNTDEKPVESWSGSQQPTKEESLPRN